MVVAQCDAACETFDLDHPSYLSLDPNERSNWKARELKSVFVEARAQFLKFLVFKNHINAINLFNQVGVVAINILGAAVPSQLPNAAQAAIDDIGIDMQLDAVTAAQIRQLHAEKVRASIMICIYARSMSARPSLAC